ncbi:hypothetical protein JCM10450v2_007532 [Rhodotorula kratochvilovae]
MLFARTLFFYGTFVNSIDLYFTASAWPRLRGPFSALAMMRARRAKGSLRTVTGSTLAKVPDELLSVISRELVLAERKDEETKVVERQLCAECAAMRESSSSSDALTLETLTDCNICSEENGLIVFDLVDSFDPSAVHFADTRFEDLDALSAVALPLTDAPYETDEDEREYGEGRRDPGYFPSMTPEAESGNYDCDDEVLEIDPSVFDLPPDANRRFAIFLSTFQLVPENPSITKLVSVEKARRDRLRRKATAAGHGTASAQPASPPAYAPPSSRTVRPLARAARWHI